MIKNLTPVSSVELRNLPFECLIQRDIPQAINWCEATFGERWSPVHNRSGRWSTYWAGFRKNSKEYRFCFATEKEMMAFLLVWS